jgi:hypothetical protein
MGDGVTRTEYANRVVEEGPWGGVVRWKELGVTTAWTKEESPNFLSERPTAEAHLAIARDFLLTHGAAQVEAVEFKLMTIREGQEKERRDVTAYKHPVVRASRSVDGFPVEDSYAWAELTQRGVPVGFSIYWPTVPSEVVEQARSLKTRLDSGWRARAAPAVLSRPYVVIGHTGLGDTRVRFRASIRAWTKAREMTYFVDFDTDGNRLPPLGEFPNPPPADWRRSPR